MSDIINLTNPYNISINNTAVSFKIEVLELILYTSATFRIILYDNNNIPLECKILFMSGFEYQDWKGSDTYVINWVKMKLNLN